MKTNKTLLLIGFLLMGAVLFTSSCKKKEDPKPDPTFVVTGIPSGDFLEFIGYCSTDDVRLTKVMIKDPLLNEYTYTAGGDIWVKNEGITFPDAYAKQLGTWRFTFVGSVVEDGRSFTVETTLSVTGK
jgi:hypothetical protein